MDTKKTNKVDILKDQVAAIEQRITTNAEAFNRLKIKAETAECEYKIARKILALENSLNNVKTEENTREELTRLRGEVDKSGILQEALVDERERLQSELSKAEHLQALEQVTIMGGKAAALIDTYNGSMMAAHDALYRLKMIASIAQRFKLQSELNAVCPGCPSGMALAIMPDFVTLELTSSGAMRHLFDNEYNQAAVMAELMTV